MGRKAISTAQKIASGAAAKNPQYVNHNEPKPPEGSPVKPADLDEVGSAMWDHVVGLFDQMGMLNQAEGLLIAEFCENESALAQARAAVRETGQVLDAYGDLKRNPHSVELHKYRDVKLKMLSEMGLTPSSRSRIVANPKKENDPFEEWLKQRDQLN